LLSAAAGESKRQGATARKYELFPEHFPFSTAHGFVTAVILLRFSASVGDAKLVTSAAR
jgi:hypothetical protein